MFFFSILIDYFFIRLPYGVVVIWDEHDTFPKTAHVYTMLFAHLNSSLNPLLYAISNPLYQKGYVNFLYWMICKKNPVNRPGFSTKKTYQNNELTKY